MSADLPDPQLVKCKREGCYPVLIERNGLVHCLQCGANGGVGSTREQAVEKWNEPMKAAYGT